MFVCPIILHATGYILTIIFVFHDLMVDALSIDAVTLHAPFVVRGSIFLAAG